MFDVGVEEMVLGGGGGGGAAVAAAADWSPPSFERRFRREAKPKGEMSRKRRETHRRRRLRH